MKQNTALARTAAVEESRKVKEENNNIKERELEERRKTEEELLLSEVEEEIGGEETKKKGVQNRIKLTHTALAAIRTQASNRQASAVATGLVQDLTMLCSLEKMERSFAIDMIFRIRGENEMGDTSVRFRLLPMLNIVATKLKDLICCLLCSVWC